MPKAGYSSTLFHSLSVICVHVYSASKHIAFVNTCCHYFREEIGQQPYLDNGSMTVAVASHRQWPAHAQHTRSFRFGHHLPLFASINDTTSATSHHRFGPNNHSQICLPTPPLWWRRRPPCNTEHVTQEGWQCFIRLDLYLKGGMLVGNA